MVESPDITPPVTIRTIRLKGRATGYFLSVVDGHLDPRRLDAYTICVSTQTWGKSCTPCANAEVLVPTYAHRRSLSGG